MKRTIIGGIIMLSGVFTVLSLILAATIYVPSITSWSGSRLWFAIFGAKQYGSEVVQSLFLGVPFVIGVVLTGIGLAILVKEYFTK
jgi:ABC-type Fe3+ transport system permease subunit